MDLNDREAWELAMTRPIGRIAHVHEGRVFVFPINPLIDNRQIYLRAAEGSMVYEAARRNAAASLEIDDLFDWSKTGWSVLIQGNLSEVTEPQQIRSVLARLQPWAGGIRNHVVRLTPQHISGRSFQPKAGGVRTVTV